MSALSEANPGRGDREETPKQGTELANTALSQCIDITFSSDADTNLPDSCTNSTGVTAEFFTGDAAGRNANESEPDGRPQNGGGHHGHDDESQQDDDSAAASVQMATWGMFGAAVAGALALL